ncbi:MAG TPA: TonB-dependent receptor [Steroidobacteraceae bacterium]|nr:TonB-dependent receptor [Steroidobacteraceae bacterium]
MSKSNSDRSNGHTGLSVGAAVALLLAGKSLVFGTSAHAQSAAAGPQQLASTTTVAAATATDATAAATATDTAVSDDTAVQEVVITGSHLARGGYNSPQPVTAITAASLDAAAPANIIDFATTLPALAGSSTPDNSSGALSNGEAGVAALNLRDLGTNRTLVLVDGQRWVPSTIEGLVDVNTIPQSLITGIDVTTGGASAAYGSGAVGGVVNFILDKKYTGIKASYQYGEYQDYGDPTRRFTLTAGTAFADGRGHAIFSGELYGDNGILTAVPSYDESGYFAMANSAANIAAGGPQIIAGPGLGLSTYTPGGLITSGALKGTYFGQVGANGAASINQLAYGSPATGQWMQGGDWQYTDSGQFGKTGLVPTQKRQNAFGRASFDLSDDAEVYVEASYGRYWGFSFYDAPTYTGSTITIQPSNYFLQTLYPSLAAKVTTPFTLGTTGAGFLTAAQSDDTRASDRAMLGADGHFNVFNMSWKWDTHGSFAQTHDIETLPGTTNNTNFANAINAVAGPNGPVCASATAQAAGCVPINVFGLGAAQLPGALAYVAGDPTRHETFELDEGAADLTTNDIKGWAGPISVAFGAEGRREAVSGDVDPIYDPTYGNYWKYGNYVATNASYTVAEAYAETLVPLYTGLDFNGAIRETRYSTSGDTDSWKLGLTYSPITDVTFRITRSADIRAGNLAELFSPGTARTNSVTNPWDNGAALLFVQKLEGSTSVVPETAKTDVYGVVFQPDFVPGFQASVDYYDIEMSNLISDLSAQQEVNACYAGGVGAQYCKYLELNAYGLPSSGASTPVIVQVYQNLYSLSERGMDLETTYEKDLASLWDKLSGKLTVHALATHYITFTTDNNVQAINLAGTNTGATPNWLGRLEAMYTKDSWSYDLVMRGVSSGSLNDATDVYLQCISACTPGKGNDKTANITMAPSAFYFDGSITKQIFLNDRATASVFFMAKNLLNRDPPRIANMSNTSYGAENTPAYPQTNTSLYDYLGRSWTLGFKVEFK